MSEIKKLKIKKKDSNRETLLEMEIGEPHVCTGLKRLGALRSVATRLKFEQKGNWRIVITDDDKAIFTVTRIS